MLTETAEKPKLDALPPERLRETVKQETGQFNKAQNALVDFVIELAERVRALEDLKT